jgi:hypothetical protein
MLNKTSNILDPIHDTLDQDVFNGTTPKEGFFEYHLNHVREVFRQNNFNPYAFRFYLTGSLCTYQYSRTSDVDISIVCDADEFEEEDRAELIAIVLESLDGSFFPRTRHQYQHFVQPFGVDIEDLFILGLRSAWDFEDNEWVLPPNRDYAHNVMEQKPDWVLAGVQVSDKINTLIDHHHYEEAKRMYKEVHARRKEDQIQYGDYSEGNVIYKFLDNNGTFDRLRNIGQKISNKKASIFEDMSEKYAVGFIESMENKPPDHLNNMGRPCNCSFAKADKNAVKDYYKSLSFEDFTKTSYVLIDDTEEKRGQGVKEIYEKVIKQEFDPNQRWSKRFPSEREQLLKLLSNKEDDFGGEVHVQLTSKNIKYLQSAIRLVKDRIREKNYVDNDANFSTSILYPTYRNYYAPANILLDSTVSQDILDMLDDNPNARELITKSKYKKFVYDFQEAYRLFATDNFGKGIEKVLIDEKYGYAKPFLQSFLQQLSIPSFYNAYKENPAKATAEFAIEQFGEGRYTYEEDKENFFNLIDPSNERPEETFNKLRISLDPTLTDEYDQLRKVLEYIRSMDIQRIVKEYNISFPTDIRQIGDWGEILQEMFRILNLVKEREEYKKNVNKLKSGDYAFDGGAVYEETFKKGNPYNVTPGKWTVNEVDSLEDMWLEGLLMNHCIGSEDQPHYNRRAEEMNKVYSVRDPNGMPRATIEMSPDSQYVAEAYGPHDHPLLPHIKRIFNGFFSQESFQRTSENPNRYVIRMADGRELFYEADSIDHAREQHEDYIKDLPDDEKKDMKAVAGYGAGHHWFDQDEDSRTGTNWSYQLEDPTPPEVEIEVDWSEHFDFPRLPAINEGFDWLQAADSVNTYVILEQLVNGYSTDPEYDDYNNEVYIYHVGGMNYDLPSVNLLIQYIENSEDELFEQVANIEESRGNPDEAKGGFDLSSEFYRMGLASLIQEKQVLQNCATWFGLVEVANSNSLGIINFYLDKRISNLEKDNSVSFQVAFGFFTLVKKALTDVKTSSDDDINDLYVTVEDFNDEDIIADALEIKPGSYSYFKNFGESSYNPNFEIAESDDFAFVQNYNQQTLYEPKIPVISYDDAASKDRDNLEDVTEVFNYGKMLLGIIDEITEAMGGEDLPTTPEQGERLLATGYFRPINGRDRGVYREDGSFNQITMKSDLGSALSSFYLASGRMGAEQGRIPGSHIYHIGYIKRYIENSLNNLEYVAHQLSLQSLEQPKDQLDFFDIPPEPSSLEYELWERNRDKITLSPQNSNPYRDQSQSLDPAEGFLNG